MGCIHNWIISEVRRYLGREEIATDWNAWGSGIRSWGQADRDGQWLYRYHERDLKCQVRKRQVQNGCTHIHLWEWKRREVQPWEIFLRPSTRRVLGRFVDGHHLFSSPPCPWQGHKFLYNGHFFRRSFASKCPRLSFTFIFFRRYAPTASKPPRFKRETATASCRPRRTPPRTACRTRGARQASPGD
jgi:hypothetical protein